MMSIAEKGGNKESASHLAVFVLVRSAVAQFRRERGKRSGRGYPSAISREKKGGVKEEKDKWPREEKQMTRKKGKEDQSDPSMLASEYCCNYQRQVGRKEKRNRPTPSSMKSGEEGGVAASACAFWGGSPDEGGLCPERGEEDGYTDLIRERSERKEHVEPPPGGRADLHAGVMRGKERGERCVLQ